MAQNPEARNQVRVGVDKGSGVEAAGTFLLKPRRPRLPERLHKSVPGSSELQIFPSQRQGPPRDPETSYVFGVRTAEAVSPFPAIPPEVLDIGDPRKMASEALSQVVGSRRLESHPLEMDALLLGAEWHRALASGSERRIAAMSDAIIKPTPFLGPVEMAHYQHWIGLGEQIAEIFEQVPEIGNSHQAMIEELDAILLSPPGHK